MKEIKMSDMFKTGLVYSYSKNEDLKIIVDEEMPKNAEIKIKNNSRGNSISGDNVTINDQAVNFTVRGSSMSIINGITYMNGQCVNVLSSSSGITIVTDQRCANLTIIGNIGKNVKISSEGEVTVDGDVGEMASIKTSMGNINTDVVHAGATLKASMGSINVRDDKRKGNSKTYSSSSTDSFSGYTSHTNIPSGGAQGFDWESFDNSFLSLGRVFNTDISDIIGQAAASGNVIRIPSVGKLHFGNTYYVNANQGPARQTQQASIRSTTVNANQAQPAATSSSESTRAPANANQRSVPPTQRSQNTGDIPSVYEEVLERNLGVAVDEHPLYQSNNVIEQCLPSYQDVVGSGAAAANYEPPPAYSENPRTNEQTIDANFYDPSISQPHIQQNIRR